MYIVYRSFLSGVIGWPLQLLEILDALFGSFDVCLPQYKVMVAPETVGYVQIPFFFSSHIGVS